MVDVTCHNFSELRSQIEEDLRGAQYVAVDAEFTCLLAEDKFSNQWFDSGPERYRKLRANLEQVAINQLGLAICTPVPGSTRYSVRVYNVFVRPTSFLDQDSTLLCQASSLAFLAQHNFDFNKWLYSGVPHLNREQVAAVQQRLHCLRTGTGNVALPMAVRDELRSIMDWSSTAALGQQYKVRPRTGSGAGAGAGAEGVPDPYSDLSFTPALLATLHNTCQDLHAWRTRGGEILVEKVSEAERESLEAGAETDWRLLADQCVDWLTGIGHVFQLMAHLKKPIVVHNGLIDIMLIYKQFFGTLPRSYSMFKSQVLSEFPLIYDTKFIAYQCKRDYKDVEKVSDYLSQTGLGQLAESLKQCHVVLFKPSIEITQQDNKYADGVHLHEAGYDAYLTCYCFLQLAHLHYSLAIPSTLRRPLEPREHMMALKHLANKINVVRGAIPYLDLSGVDPAANRPSWIIVENMSQWRSAVADLSSNVSPDSGPTTDSAPNQLETKGSSAGVMTVNNNEPSTAHKSGGGFLSHHSKTSLNPSALTSSQNTIMNESGTREQASLSRHVGSSRDPLPRFEAGELAQRCNAAPLHQFTPDSVSALLSRFGSVDVRPWRRNKLLVATASYETQRIILSSLRVPSLKVYPYSRYRHSWVARGAIWTGLLASTGLSALLLYSFVRDSQ